MKGYRNKPKSQRRSRDETERHWLKAGRQGREYLIDEVDAVSFAVDGYLSRRAMQLAHRLQPVKARPLAVFVPPYETVGWFGAFLSAKFDVLVVVSKPDDFQEAAADRFGMKLIYQDDVDQFGGMIDLFVCCDPHWPDFRAFTSAVRSTRDVLSDEGETHFVLAGVQHGDARFLRWSDGTMSPIQALGDRGSAFLSGPCNEVASIPLCDVALPLRAQEEFTQRHRLFFGKQGEELWAERFSRGDFRTDLTEHGAPASRETAFVLSWLAATEPGSQAIFEGQTGS